MNKRIKNGFKALGKSYELLVAGVVTCISIWALAMEGVSEFGFILLPFFINYIWLKLEEISMILGDEE